MITLQNLSKTYHSEDVAVEALKAVNLEIKKGQFVTLAGPSGSGKSTLLHLLGALDYPSGGKIFIQGQDLSSLDKNQLAEFRLRKVGFVFQAYNLISVLSAYENVEYILLLQGVDAKTRKEKAIQLLERVGLKDYINTRPVHMSGGQQQRVAVARAIAANPELVLADEPTANLDSKTGEALIDLFRELAQSFQMTFILASHDPMVMQKTKRLVRLKDGEIIEDTTLNPSP